ncbi:O-fucosyltransferase 23 [Orobanche minor]
MNWSNCLHLNSLACKCLFLIVIALFLRTVLLPIFSGNGGNGVEQSSFVPLDNLSLPLISGKMKFLEVPQIVWGLNNQKIAFARACLTARMMNHTLLMPSLSASLFYKEVDLLQPIDFDKVFQFERFNSLCAGFVQLGRYSNLKNRSNVFELRQYGTDEYNEYETIRIVGKNPFLWHDHWPVKDYAKVFECIVLVDEISREADKIVSKIREIAIRSKSGLSENGAVRESQVPYVAVHMRIEKDWMIHCKKLEHKSNITEICSSKEEIMERVANIPGLNTPTVVYLAVAGTLLEDSSILNGWKENFIPFEKKKLGVFGIYKKHPYLIQSAIDYEVCLRANVFVGNSYSTFSSLLVLERTHKMIRTGVPKPCGVDVSWPSYAYNLKGDVKGPRPWMTNLSDSSLRAISYGSNDITC